MDTTTLLIVVGIVLLVMFLLNRSRAGVGGPPLRGDERPRYDDPDYTSTGSIGGGSPAGSSQVYNDPDYTSAGSIGGGTLEERSVGASEPPLRERSVGESTESSSSSDRTHDDPNYRSGGSIGG
jgi:hypothetical protein